MLVSDLQGIIYYWLFLKTLEVEFIWTNDGLICRDLEQACSQYQFSDNLIIEIS